MLSNHKLDGLKEHFQTILILYEINMEVIFKKKKLEEKNSLFQLFNFLLRPEWASKNFALTRSFLIYRLAAATFFAKRLNLRAAVFA